MRIFVTGVGGFVGYGLARHLVELGDQVGGSFLGHRPRDLEGVDLYEADVLDEKALAAALQAFAPQVVVHLAGLSHVGASWKRMAEYFRVNVLGTENVLAETLESPAQRRLVVASSCEVYGYVPENEQPIGEGRRLDPRSPYAMTKAAMERLALSRGATVVRSFNLVGCGQSTQFALPSFAAQLGAIARGEREAVLRVGNLNARRDFLHVADGVKAYRLVACRGEPGTAYNLASGQAVSIDEALRILLQVSGLEVRVEEDPARVRPVDMPVLRGDASRLRRLGWTPEKSLRDALDDLWTHERNRGGKPTASCSDDIPSSSNGVE